MKNLYVYLAIAIFILFLMKEGEKQAAADPENQNVLGYLKLGFKSTMDTLTGKNVPASSNGSTDSFAWEPNYSGELPSIDMMTFYNPNYYKSSFHGFNKLQQRGTFIHPVFSKRAN